MIEIKWTEECCATIDDKFLFGSFVELYQKRADEPKDVEDIIDWLEFNLHKNAADFLELMDIEPSDWLDDADYYFVDYLLSDRMIDKFRKFYKEVYE